MEIRKLALGLVAGVPLLVSGTTSVEAANFGADGGASLQAVLDDFTLLPNPGDSSVDVTTDEIADNLDSLWSITATGGSVATIIVELAEFAASNVFGIYDAADPDNMVPIFGGAAAAGDQAVVTITNDGSVKINFVDTTVDFAGNLFGYYLDSSAQATGGVFKSDTSLNTDGVDHMYAYQGTNTDTVQLPGLADGLWTDNEFVLAWEDLVNGGDMDYEDFVVMVESVQPVPLPGAVWLFGSALLAAAGVVRRKRLVA